MTTGISAADRARTIGLLADPSSTTDSFVRPGHVIPLRAKAGGVLERPGHTEAAVDLCRLAGLAPADAGRQHRRRGGQVVAQLLALLTEIPVAGRQVHDANIVATMLVYGVRRVLTHNTEDFVRFAAFIEVLPLVPPPAPAPPPRPPAPRCARASRAPPGS